MTVAAASYPSAEMVAAAIVAACRKVSGETAEDVAAGKKAKSSRARIYAFVALQQICQDTPELSLAKCVGCKTRISAARMIAEAKAERMAAARGRFTWFQEPIIEGILKFAYRHVCRAEAKPAKSELSPRPKPIAPHGPIRHSFMTSVFAHGDPPPGRSELDRRRAEASI